LLLPTFAEARSVACRIVLLTALSTLFFLPYLHSYSGGQEFGLWEGSRTPLEFYILIHGISLFPVLTTLGLETWRAMRRTGSCGRYLLLAAGAGATLTVGASLALAVLGYQIALVAVPLFAASCYLVLAPDRPPQHRVVWLMAGSAAVLALAVELLVLKSDIGRMNTVFKVYLQVWTLLATAGAVTLAWAYAQSPSWRRWARASWRAAMALLALGGALFLPLGIRARAVDRIADDMPVTLDGAAFMARAEITDGDPSLEPRQINLAGDAAAIRWLQDNVLGSPVIMEGLGHREYLWANRVSIYTGLPAVVGWRWHQVQQRPGLPSLTVDRRRADVNRCYQTGHAEVAWTILERYGVKYVYVGDYERAYYSAEGIAKFRDMVGPGEGLRVAYDSGGVTVYEVVRTRDGT
jgi:YYY domain-containing protein